MNEYKVLSVNPGATDQLPAMRPIQSPAPEYIAPMAERIAYLFGGKTASYLQGSATRLLLRLIGALAIGGSGWLQMQGTLCVFGIETEPYICGMVTMILSVMMMLGITGRFAPLCLATLSVMSLVSHALNNGGVADLSVGNQLSMIYGAIAATVAVLGTGRYTLPCWIAGIINKRKRG